MADGSFDGIENIRSAAASLATKDSRLKSRLASAGERFWSALNNREEWPEELQESARRIESMILRDGPVQDTVSAMDLDTARKTAAEILQFMVDFEVALSEDSGESS